MFEEAPIIRDTLTDLARWFPAAQLIVVDDGSGDGTAAVAQAFAREHDGTDVIVLPENQGKGRAVAAACAAVKGERVVIVDADLAYGQDAIRRAADALDRADMAAGNRRHADSTYTVPVRVFGFLYRRHVLGWVFNRAVRALLGLTVRDTQCGLKSFRTTPSGGSCHRCGRPGSRSTSRSGCSRAPCGCAWPRFPSTCATRPAAAASGCCGTACGWPPTSSR